MQSNNFVEGVSGWRMSRGLIEMYGGPAPIILGSLSEPEPEQPKPFIVVDGVTYINATCIKDALVEPKISVHYTIKPQVLNGKLVFAGFHIDDCDTRPEYEKARDAGAMDEYFAKILGTTPLYQSLREQIEQVLASEPGSINKRLDEFKEKQGAENRAVAARLDSLATKLGELHSLIGQAKGQATTQAKREVAEALLRDIELDKDGGTLGDCKRRFGACSIPFGGYSGVPLKGDYPKDAARSDDDGTLAEALDQWASKKTHDKVLESANGKLKINFSTGEFWIRP